MLTGILIAAAVATAPAKPEVRRVESPRAALEEILAQGPRVVAFGEYHQTRGGAKVASSLKRFTEQLLPLLPPRTSDIVVETFITTGKCGEEEKAVVADVEKTTERPAETESEVVTLLKRAKGAGIQPHILEVSCEEYAAVRGEGGEVDYEKVLTLIKTQLQSRITQVLARRGENGKAVVVYGGALHNDLYPKEILKAFTFGQEVRGAVAGKYIEVDLYVPEYIESDKGMRAEPWFKLYRRAARPGKTVLVRRGAGSYIIVFPRS